jgi:DHA2 family multidrug resistance protein
MIPSSHRALIKPEHALYPWLVLANVLLITFVALLSAAITIVAESSIQGELALSMPEASWITTLYLLGVNSLVPAANRFADRFGYRKMYSLGVAIFTLGSLASGLAQSFLQIGIARLLEGVGAGLVFPIGLALISQTMKPQYIALSLVLYIAIGFGAGLGLGSFLSGYFAMHYSWRDIFFLIFPLGCLAGLGCWSFEETKKETVRGPFDLWGYLLFISFIASLLVALSFGALRSTTGGWKSPFILSCFAIAAVSLIGSILVESRVANPILPLKLFRDPAFSTSCAALFLLGMALFSSIAVSTNFFLNAMEYSKGVTGILCTSYGISMALSTIAASALMKKIRVSMLTLCGLGVLVFSYFWNNEVTLQSPPEQIVALLILRGMGVGLSLGPITGFALQEVAPNMRSEAATLLTFFRQVGATYGGTIITIITIKRQIFHVARFSETVHVQNPGFQETWTRLFNRFSADVSGGVLIPAQQAQATIIKVIEMQAFVQALNDAMIIFGIVTLIVGMLLLTLDIVRTVQKRLSSTESA